ncbi:MAG: glycosyltransferase family 2 protein [Pseudomonadota bacterium]
MIDHISIVIITRNAADTLDAALASVDRFSNVVVYDNNSDDLTPTIARQHHNVAYHEGAFTGFGPTKNAAVDLAQNDWVFSLDADEKMNPILVDALARWSPGDIHSVGEIVRENQFMGQTIHRGGWGNDRLIRLFNRTVHRFNDAAVHEKVKTTNLSKIKPLQGVILHATVRELSQCLQKVDRYTELRRDTLGHTYPSSVIFLKALFTFFRTYVLKLGLLDGWRGLAIAWSEANGTFYKYMKIHADRQVKRERPRIPD